jgi:hypothetical protein
MMEFHIFDSMSEITLDTSALRQKGVEMLSTLEDRKLLERVVGLIQKSYMEEIVEYERDGSPVTRADLFAMLQKGNEAIDRGEGVKPEELNRKIQARFGKA